VTGRRAPGASGFAVESNTLLRSTSRGIGFDLMNKDRDLECPGPLGRDAGYTAPGRSRKRFEEIKAIVQTEYLWGRPAVREWVKGDLRRLYWKDGSYMFVDGAGEVRTNGGLASQAKIKNGLR
jgi:hypothetical protein